jgi:hypothetical protein
MCPWTHDVKSEHTLPPQGNSEHGWSRGGSPRQQSLTFARQKIVSSNFLDLNSTHFRVVEWVFDGQFRSLVHGHPRAPRHWKHHGIPTKVCRTTSLKSHVRYREWKDTNCMGGGRVGFRKNGRW